MGLLVRYEGFRWLWVGQLLSQMGNAIFLIMGLWEIQLHSPFLLSIAGVVMAVPALLAMVGGVVVDRYDARRLMLMTDIMRGVAVALGIVALSVPGSLATVVIVLLGINSLGAALFSPAESVMIPRLVKETDLAAANGIYSLTYQVSSAVGSVIGGAAIAAIGVGVVFGIDMGSFWLSALGIALMMRVVTAKPRIPPQPGDVPAPAAAGDGGLLASFRAGLEALRGIPGIMQLLPLVVLVNFAATAAFTMLPYWIHHTLGADALWYGLISAGWGVGLVAGGISTGFFARWPLRAPAALTFGAMALLLGAFAVSTSSPLSGGLLLVAGVANGVGNALTYTVMQRMIPDELRGRAFGLMMTLFGVATPLGALAAGAFLHILPLYWSWAFSAVVGVALAVALWVYIPADMRAPQTADQTA